MNSKYQDAMAIVHAHGKPDLFITMTMNPNHPDVTAALLPEQSPSDQPDIITRVFIDCKLKLYSHSFITRLIWSYDMTPTPHSRTEV